MKCSRCQQHNPSHAMFCPECGTPRSRKRNCRDDVGRRGLLPIALLTERSSRNGEPLRGLPRRRATVEMTSAELTTIKSPTEKARDPIPNTTDRYRFDIMRPAGRASEVASYI